MTTEIQPRADAEIPDRIIPLTGMRGMIASKMKESISTSAQLTHIAECDATALNAAKAQLAERGLKASVEDLLVHAVVSSLRKHPSLNATLEENAIRVKSAMNISCAIALPGDLLVAPTILNADRMSLEERIVARRDLVERARINKLSVKEMTAGTFTLSNIGLSRVRYFTPILNMPQVAILGIGEAGLRPWVVGEGRIEARPVMGLSLTFDHRAVNGAPAANFLTDLCQAIEQFKIE
ncbi:2-oxo acid dehydrogenase subunit E2 [Hyphomicrobium sp. LHD-15]|uniref:2-oxo acid dehydrogenase subunit E2 n=1 Tax=Hyphomicrobium sp. LHD-15 TaxID=3072142 RepID=UPI00280C9DC2|nr:2-oxo acid dehydrogenase subunit E2 [Hyphomicrobium sp. LHD-15]MDQ8698411.1 2-oxo acid dehydrogenase subunit E2 [Hyphomicrobium sp. LHD-15]